MEQIEELLKNNEDSRIQHGDKWLVWAFERWVIYTRLYGKRTPTIDYYESLADALKSLAEG